MKILNITHNAGFFSCFSKRLEGIVWFFNTYKTVPDRIDSSEQFALFKANSSDDLTSFYFSNNDQNIKYVRGVHFHNDEQFLDYADLDFEGLKPFVEKYFSPNAHVREIVSKYEEKYAINPSATCAVFYRGNDKSTETIIAPYEAFIAQARKIQEQDPSVVFLVQTDETEFLEAFQIAFPGAVYFEEIPHMRKNISAMHDELPLEKRAEFGADFFAATLVLSKCKYLITHSGNGGLWSVLYRGHSENVYQWLAGSWQRSKLQRFLIRAKIVSKKILKHLLNRGLNGSVIES